MTAILRPTSTSGLTDAREAVRAVADTALWTLTDLELVADVADALALRAQADALLLARLAEADTRGLARSRGATSMTAWLRGSHRLGAVEASRLVRTARALREQVPATAEGMAQGEVHLSQAEVIVESMKDLSESVLPAQRADGEQTLLDACSTLDPAGLGQLGRRLEELLDPEGVQARDEAKIRDHEAKAFRGRELTLSPDPYGSGGLIRGRYDAAGYAVIAAALDALSCPWSEGAAASGEVGIAGFGESIDQRTPAQRRYDALVEVCRRHLHSPATTSGDGGKAQIRVTIPLASLVDRGGYGVLDGGLAISPTVARMLACDAGLIPAVLNRNGAPIDLGRERRLYTGAARTAIEIRDGGCVWPGCARPPSWTQVHHLLAWSSGGRTDQRNGGLFCWHHHREIESSEWEEFYHRGRIWLQPPTRIDLRRRPRINLTHRPIPPHRDWPSGASGGPAP